VLGFTPTLGQSGVATQLVIDKKAKEVVYNLNAFNGKLLVGLNQNIQLYKWTFQKDGVS
jgi:DNA damage-binding protein 1